MIARIQGGGTTSASPQNVTLGSIPQVGHLLVASVATSNNAATFTSVVLDPDGINLSFTPIFEEEGGVLEVPISMWYLVVDRVPSSAVVRATNSTTCHLNVIEISGNLLTGVLDVWERVTDQVTATASDSGDGETTTSLFSFLIGALGTNGSVTNITGGSNDQGENYSVSSTTSRSGLLWLPVYGMKTYDAKATWTTTQVWSMGFAAFKCHPGFQWNNYQHIKVGDGMSMTEKIK